MKTDLDLLGREVGRPLLRLLVLITTEVSLFDLDISLG